LGLLAFFFGASTFAQSGNEGSIEGLIIDPSGAVIFGVNVTARDIDTAAIYRAVTDGDGRFRFLVLPVGTYQVTVPAGTFPAVLFRVNCEGKVGPAHTHNTGYNFFAPGVGMVAMILEEDVTAFWLFNIDSTTGKVLMSK